MAVDAGEWQIEFRPWGWVRLREQEGGPAVYIQYEITGGYGQGRLDMQCVVMMAGQDDALSARTWRRIPFSTVETYLNLSNARDIVTAQCATPAPSLEGLERFFEESASYSTFTVTEPSGMLVPDGADDEPARKLPQVKPPQGKLTDEFLKDVAAAYRWYADAQKAPAPAISEMAEVPVRTVHRWIYEARKRGILPPARTGRAG